MPFEVLVVDRCIVSGQVGGPCVMLCGQPDFGASPILSHERIWSALDALAREHALSASGLARRAGLDPTAFNKSKRWSADGRARWPSTESLAKVLDATGATLEDLIGLIAGQQGESHRSTGEPISGIPLLGLAQAGAGGYFDDAGFPSGQGWDMIEFPGAAKRPVYALTVHGESMLPLYRHGDVLIVEPGAAVRRDDRVVVKTAQGEVMAKILHHRTSGSVTLRSFNPDHPDRMLNNGEIEWIARVVWASQ